MGVIDRHNPALRLPSPRERALNICVRDIEQLIVMLDDLKISRNLAIAGHQCAAIRDLLKDGPRYLAGGRVELHHSFERLTLLEARHGIVR